MSITTINTPVSLINNAMQDGLNPVKSSGNKAETRSFAQIVSQKLEEVNSLQITMDQLTVDFVAGKPVEIHQMLIAAEKADLALRQTVAIRDKLIDAYKQIANMQI